MLEGQLQEFKNRAEQQHLEINQQNQTIGELHIETSVRLKKLDVSVKSLSQHANVSLFFFLTVFVIVLW